MLWTQVKRRLVPVLLAGLLLASTMVPVAGETPATGGTAEAAFTLPALAGTAAGALPEDQVPLDPYIPVAKTEQLELYADESTGDFALADLRTGRVWYSSPPDFSEDTSTTGASRTNLLSLIVVHYVSRSTIAASPTAMTANSRVGSVSKNAAAYEVLENGYRMTYRFPLDGFEVPVEVTLTSGGLAVSVPGDGIVYFPAMTEDDWYEQMESGGDTAPEEGAAADSLVTAVDVLPGFLAGGPQAEGYLFVPSGSGAVVDFNNGRGQYGYFSGMVYGDDLAIRRDEEVGVSQDVRAPVYGIQHGGHTMTAIIASGDASAMILADGTHETFGYNRAYARFVTAVVDNTKLFEADYFNQRVISDYERREKPGTFTVAFIPSAGEEIGYAGMAAVYRRYLEANSRLSKAPQAPALSVGLYGAGTRKASFLGIPYTQTFAMTSFSQAEEILEDLREDGVGNVALQYLGWTGAGMDNDKIPVKAQPVGKLGGKSGLRSLLGYLEDRSLTGYFDVDFITMRKSGNGYSVLSDTVRSLFNTRVPQYRYMLSVKVPVLTENPWYLLKPGGVSKAASRFAGTLDDRAGVSLAGVGGNVYSHFAGAAVSREETVREFARTAAAFDGTALAVSGGNAYTYAYAGRVFGLPQTNGGQLLLNRSVPFLQMVLHGYIPYTGEDAAQSTRPEDALLHCLETGADPYFTGMYCRETELIDTRFNHLYANAYATWSEWAKTLYAAYAAVYADLYDQPITGHRRTEDGVAVTTFAGGARIYVNYADSARTVEGVTIEAKGYVRIG